MGTWFSSQIQFSMKEMGLMFNPYDYYVTPEEYTEVERRGISQIRVNQRIRSYAWPKLKTIITPLKV